MQFALIGGDRFAQSGKAQIVDVEGFSIRDRLLGSLADEIGRHLVAFAEPERGHVGMTHSRIGDIADARGRERENFGAGIGSHMGNRTF